MLIKRPSAERGHANHGWLDSHHTFSFANYFDENFMGFRSLRVINEDHIVGGAGFPTHPHRDMEIISYCLSGGIEHKDSMGTGSVIRPGDVQRMTAGTGVTHSEFNASKTEAAHFLQIWILPEARGLAPGYEQKTFSQDEKLNQLRLVASRDGREGSVTIHQDISLFASVLEAGREVEMSLGKERYLWVQTTRGSIVVNGETLVAGDGAALAEENKISVHANEDSEFLVFDMA